MLLFQSLIFTVFCFTNTFAASPILPTTESLSTAATAATTLEPSTSSSATIESAASTSSPTSSSTTSAKSVEIVNSTTILTASIQPSFPKAVQNCIDAKSRNEDEYLCFLKLREQEGWKKDLKAEYELKIQNLYDPRIVHKCPGISDIGIIIMAVVLALLILIGNGAALGYFFRWNYKPLSRRPTEDEMDDVLDADLPIMLINHEKRAGEFQFAAKAEKDTQTIMANEPQQTEQQQSSIPSELKSAGPEDQDPGAPGGQPPLLPPAGTPRPGGAGKRGGRGGGGGGGRGLGRK